MGRFVSSDIPELSTFIGEVSSTNLYTYCSNDCVGKLDEFGYGTIDKLIKLLDDGLDVFEKFLDMIKYSYVKEKEAIQKSVRGIISGKKKKQKKKINSLIKEIDKLGKKIDWIANAILITTLISILSSEYKYGKSVERGILDAFIEILVDWISDKTDDLFEKLIRCIPGIGVLVSIIGGWLISYALDKFFSSKRIKRIKNKFAKSVGNCRINIHNWMKYGLKSLSA